MRTVLSASIKGIIFGLLVWAPFAFGLWYNTPH